jgi:hypothetical protein
MHFRFFVTFDAEYADSSATAREYVYDFLMAEGFCSQGRWGGGMADWFVIGGRWSGELSRHSWARTITTRMEALEQQHHVQVRGTFYGDEEKQRIQQELAKQLQQMWDAEAPAAYVGIPYIRDTYERCGYADDAMLLTQELYDALLKEYEGQEEFDYHADLEYAAISPEMVGKKWLVVVDYHT